jgi:hypothetical protein
MLTTLLKAFYDVGPPAVLYTPGRVLNSASTFYLPLNAQPHICSDLPLPLPVVFTYPRPVRRPENTTDLLFRLDAIEYAGLTDAELKALFSRCPCGLTMTRRAYRRHSCSDIPASRTRTTVVDLTSDDSDVDEALRLSRDSQESEVARLFRLDAMEGAGLTDAEFRELFARCPCGLTMTHRSYRFHVCGDAVAFRTRPTVVSDDLEDYVLDLSSDSEEPEVLSS